MRSPRCRCRTISWRGSRARPGSACSRNIPPISARLTWSGRSSRPHRLKWRPEMWGIIPAAGIGSRIQPLAFSKELLPVGSRVDGAIERPRAVSEYLVERMLLAGADKLCFVISPGKSDILEYYGAGVSGAEIVYVVQPGPGGLCDAVFRAVPFIPPHEDVLVG